MSRWMLSGALAVALAGTAPAQQQEQKPAPQGSGAPAQPQTSPKPAEKPQTLDELLGLEAEKAGARRPEGRPPPPAPDDPAAAALERKLTNAEVSEAFVQAVRLMDQTALRIERSRDTGLTTQRMQEDVVRKLDALIAQAEKQQRQSRSRPSRSSSQDPQQPDQQQQQQASSQQQTSSGENRDERDPPGRRDGELGPAMAQGAAWGALPERMRDALLQGNADRFSSVWGQMTEAYYRKLAEEAGR
jgi:hypothetical protein